MRIPLALFNLHLYTHISKDKVVFEGEEKVNILFEDYVKYWFDNMDMALNHIPSNSLH